MNNNLKTEKFERCIICDAMTNVPISMPIDWRINYEIGCGQICAECAKKQRKAVERETALAHAQIMFNVEQNKKESK